MPSTSGPQVGVAGLASREVTVTSRGRASKPLRSSSRRSRRSPGGFTARSRTSTSSMLGGVRSTPKRKPDRRVQLSRASHTSAAAR
jgi:hypothetical protein